MTRKIIDLIPGLSGAKKVVGAISDGASSAWKWATDWMKEDTPKAAEDQKAQVESAKDKGMMESAKDVKIMPVKEDKGGEAQLKALAKVVKGIDNIAKKPPGKISMVTNNNNALDSMKRIQVI